VQITAEDLRVLVGWLRVLPDRTQGEMAAAAQIHPTTLSRYEHGGNIPDRRMLEKLAAAVPLPMWAIDGLMLPVIAVTRALATGEAAELPKDVPGLLAVALNQPQSAAASAAIAEFLLEPTTATGEAEASQLPPAIADDQDLAVLEAWSFAPTPVAESPPPAGLGWWRDLEGLVERLCIASEEAAAHDAARSLELAQVALGVAELAPGPAGLQSRLRGFVWGFVGNAQRVGSMLPAAAASFASASTLWRTGASAPGSRLAEWRLLDLEASLRRDQRQFVTALDLLDRALAQAPTAARGRILLKKAYTLEQAGEVAGALAALREAAPLVDAAGEPRQSWGLHHNLLLVLCQLGHYAEAEAGLPELQARSLDLGNDLDRLRTRWVTARVWAGRGRRGEAAAELDEVREEFAQRRIAYDTALVSLELAILHLEDGRGGEARALAGPMLWIFDALEVGRETLAALTLFRRAAESETLTLALARRVLSSLERTRSGEGAALSDPAWG
jgi:transcriptional regulator with XRE-family HTH domain/tetratricopeptide (TPR) repeat protein